MNDNYKKSANIQEMWEQLSNKWQGDDATAFYREYVIKISEMIESFNKECSELNEKASECMVQLNIIEQTLSNQ